MKGEKEQKEVVLSTKVKLRWSSMRCARFSPLRLSTWINSVASGAEEVKRRKRRTLTRPQHFLLFILKIVLECVNLHQCNDVSITGSDHIMSSFSFGNLHVCKVLCLSLGEFFLSDQGIDVFFCSLLSDYIILWLHVPKWKGRICDFILRIIEDKLNWYFTDLFRVLLPLFAADAEICLRLSWKCR